MRPIRDFIELRSSGKLENNVTWRNYAIEDAITIEDARAALKHLGYHNKGEFGYNEFAADYGVDPGEAFSILASWWIWASLGVGKLRRRVKYRPIVPKPPA